MSKLLLSVITPMFRTRFRPVPIRAMSSRSFPVVPALALALLAAASVRLPAQDTDASLQQSINAYNKGIDAFNKGDNDTAVTDFTQAIELDPALARAYLSRGRVYGTQGAYDKAIADFDRALQFDGKNEEAYYSRGRVFAAEGDDPTAIADFSEALQLNPDDASAWLYRGSALADQGNNDAALSDLNHAIKLDPKIGHAWYVRAGINKARGDYAGALADYKQLLQLEPKNSDACNDRAWLLATCPQAAFRDGKQAVADAVRACELTQWNNPAPLDTLAAASAEAGDFASAVKWENKCLAFPDLDPTVLVDAQNHLILYQAGKPYHADK